MPLLNSQPTEPRAPLLAPPPSPAVVPENLPPLSRLGRAFERGQLTYERGILGTKLRSDPSPEVQAETERMRARIDELGGDGDGFVGWLASASEFVGQRYETLANPQILDRMSKGATAGLMVGGTTAVGAAPGTVLGAVAGATAHFIEDSFRVEGGLSYLEQLEQGVDPEVAKWTSMGVGVLNAGLETLGLAAVTAPLSRSAKELFKSSTRKAMSDPRVLDAVRRATVAYGGAIAGETATEVLQEGVAIAGEEIGKAFTEGELERISPEEAAERIAEVAVKTFRAMTVLAVPGAGASFATDVRQARRATHNRELLDTFKEAAEKLEPEEAPAAMADALTKAGVTEVYIPAEQLRAVVELSGADVQAVEAQLGVSERMEDAIALGHDVVLTQQKLVEVLGSDLYGALADHIRFDEEGMTAAEAKEFGKSGMADAVAEVGLDEEEVQTPEATTVLDEQFGLQGIFRTAADAGLTDKQYEAYLGKIANAKEARTTAKEQLRVKRALRDNRTEVKQTKEALQETAREAVDNQPVYVALNAIGRERLDAEAVRDILGKDAERLPKQGGRSVLAPEREVGRDPEEVAEIVGFEDAETMLRAMLAAPPKDQAITAEVDRLFVERHHELSEQQKTLQDELQAIHNEPQGDVIALELNQLRQSVKLKKLKPRLIKIAARDRLRDYKLRDIKPNKFLQAERREAKLAAKLLRAGDIAGAAQAKFRQLVNFQMALESYKVLERTKRQHKYFKGFIGRRRAPLASKGKITAEGFSSVENLFPFGTAYSTTELEVRNTRGDVSKFEVGVEATSTVRELMSRYYTPNRFKGAGQKLAQALQVRFLATIPDTEVLLVDATDFEYAYGPGIMGLYQPNQDNILLSTAMLPDPKLFIQTAMHEMVHAATARQSDLFQRDIEALMNIAELQQPKIAGQYGMTNHNEFLAEALSNPRFQAFLANVKLTKEQAEVLGLKDWKNRSLFDAFVDLVRRILQLEPDQFTALEGIIKLFDDISQAPPIIGAGSVLEARRSELPVDYLLLIRSLLGAVDLKRRLSIKQQVADLAEDGMVVDLPPRVIEADGRTNYLDLTLRDWEQLYDQVRALQKQGLEENKFLREQTKATRQETIDAVVANVTTNVTPRKGAQVETRWEEAKEFGRGLRLLLFNADTLLREVDGFKSLGAAYRAIKRPYDLAMNEGYHAGQEGFMARSKREAKELVRLYGMFTKSELLNMKKRHVQVPGVKGKITHQRLLAVLLNSGNLENRAALVESGQFTETEIDAIHAAASEKDWKFTQAVWDYLETFWPEVEASVKRRENRAPEKVQATPIETPYGTMRGGYYPLEYDARESVLSFLSASDNTNKIIQEMRFGNFTKSMTQHGHTEMRIGSGKRAVKLDLFVLNSHVNQVIYDLEVGDAVMDIYKVLHSRAVKRAFGAVGRVQNWEQLDLWFANIVMGEQHLGHAVERMFRHLRTGFVVSKLGFNIGTVLLQPLGLLQSGALVGKTNVAWGTLQVLMNPRSFSYVRAQTGFMRNREASFNREIVEAQTALKNSLLRRVTPGNSAKFISDMAFYTLIKMQGFVDVATWLAAKRQGLKMFDGDEVKANEHADRMVARTQASGIFGERTPLERGTISKKVQQTEAIRVLVPLISYFMAKTNVAYERIRATNYRNPFAVINLVTDLILMYLVEALAVAWLRGDWPEEDEDWGWFMAWEGTKALFAGVPGFRDLASEVEGFRGGGVGASVAGEFGAFADQVRQGEIDEALVKSGARFGGTLLRVPGTSQMIKTGSAVYQAEQGEDIEAIEFLMGPRWRE